MDGGDRVEECEVSLLDYLGWLYVADTGLFVDTVVIGAEGEGRVHGGYL